MSALTLLGIETSCDDTAAAVVRRAPDGAVSVLADQVLRQNDAHAPFGGVVPEIAARAHAELLDGVIGAAMADAQMGWDDLDGVAATAGPGLIGGVMVGLVTGKAIALARDLPFVAVNHLEAHALSPRLVEPLAFPYLVLLVSGGHTQLLLARDVGRYRRLGSTIDDAAGEAFDKTAKLMGLPHPGGPALEAAAYRGEPVRFALPRPFLGASHADFSFAGLKTAALRVWEGLAEPNDQDRADLAAAFQAAAADVLADRARRAMVEAAQEGCATIALVGGVAANAAVRATLETAAADCGYRVLAPPARWCTDNAAMVALAGAERLTRGLSDGLDVAARPRWPLDAEAAAAAPALGAGRKGAKA